MIKVEKIKLNKKFYILEDVQKYKDFISISLTILYNVNNEVFLNSIICKFQIVFQFSHLPIWIKTN